MNFHSSLSTRSIRPSRYLMMLVGSALFVVVLAAPGVKTYAQEVVGEGPTISNQVACLQACTPAPEENVLSAAACTTANRELLPPCSCGVISCTVSESKHPVLNLTPENRNLLQILPDWGSVRGFDQRRVVIRYTNDWINANPIGLRLTLSSSTQRYTVPLMRVSWLESDTSVPKKVFVTRPLFNTSDNTVFVNFPLVEADDQSPLALRPGTYLVEVWKRSQLRDTQDATDPQDTDPLELGFLQEASSASLIFEVKAHSQTGVPACVRSSVCGYDCVPNKDPQYDVNNEGPNLVCQPVSEALKLNICEKQPSGTCGWTFTDQGLNYMSAYGTAANACTIILPSAGCSGSSCDAAISCPGLNPGDVNHDGDVDISYYTYWKSHFRFPSIDPIAYGDPADMNKDGYVDTSDWVLIVNHISF